MQYVYIFMATNLWTHLYELFWTSHFRCCSSFPVKITFILLERLSTLEHAWGIFFHLATGAFVRAPFQSTGIGCFGLQFISDVLIGVEVRALCKIVCNSSSFTPTASFMKHFCRSFGKRWGQVASYFVYVENTNRQA